MAPERRSVARRLVEWALVAVGVASLTQYFWLSRQLDQDEADNRDAVMRMLADRENAPPPPADLPRPDVPDDESLPSTSPPPRPAPESELIGEIAIPRLGVSAAVRAGEDDRTLDGAVGHLPDTALPWQDGNTALAAHRDRLFRSLERIEAGDAILFATSHGTFRYAVSRTFIVNPEDVWVLQPSDGVDLTLITCYPFTFLGHAPQRFVVRARKIDSRVVRPGPDVEGERDE